jgi:pimeloyl-ACP methyl ester carboxylesterase
MTPVSFGGCFGWLHATPDRASAETAVLICMPFGYDALPAYCSLRLLADQLADVGYPTLRFDYPGTGDSCDEPVDVAGGHWAAWRRSIDDAATWLRRTTGAERLVICGMRGGALLAGFAAAEREDIAGLLLLAPVLRGRSYIRQLQVEAQLKSAIDRPLNEGLVFREFDFNAATVAAVEAADLREMATRPGQKIAIATPSPSRLTSDCIAAWQASGAETTELGWRGLAPLMRQNTLEENDLADFSSVLHWLRQAVPARPSLGSSPFLPAVELRPAGCIETPVRFGSDGRLFGILCRPERGGSETVLLIGNGGRDPHYGAARQSVALARKLARRGGTSLRMDFAGLGDSDWLAAQKPALSSMFEESRVVDTVDALDFLETQGYRRFAMTGLCAGAYHAFMAALVDRRLSVLLLTNMPFLTLPKVNPVDYVSWHHWVPSNFLHRLLRPRSWRRLFELRREIGAMLYIQLTKLQAGATARLARFRRSPAIDRGPTFAQSALASLSRRGVYLLFAFTANDDGIKKIERELDCPAAEIERTYPGVAVRMFPHMNHDLTFVAGRAAAESTMMDVLAADAVPPRDFVDPDANEVLA